MKPSGPESCSYENLSGRVKKTYMRPAGHVFMHSAHLTVLRVAPWSACSLPHLRSTLFWEVRCCSVVNTSHLFFLVRDVGRSLRCPVRHEYRLEHSGLTLWRKHHSLQTKGCSGLPRSRASELQRFEGTGAKPLDRRALPRASVATEGVHCQRLVISAYFLS